MVEAFLLGRVEASPVVVTTAVEKSEVLARKYSTTAHKVVEAEAEVDMCVVEQTTNSRRGPCLFPTPQSFNGAFTTKSLFIVWRSSLPYHEPLLSLIHRYTKTNLLKATLANTTILFAFVLLTNANK